MQGQSKKIENFPKIRQTWHGFCSLSLSLSLSRIRQFSIKKICLQKIKLSAGGTQSAGLVPRHYRLCGLIHPHADAGVFLWQKTA